MRVISYRNGAGFSSVEVAGEAGAAIAAVRPLRKETWKQKLARQRRMMGRPVFFGTGTRRRRVEHGLPRSACLGGMVDPLVMAAIKREAARRGLAKGALVGRIIETIVDDDLFAAILGDA